jgi:hypothetical protein
MPRSVRTASAFPADTESIVRRAVEWLFTLVYERVGVLVLAIVAFGVAVYAFTVSFGEGIRAIIFFVIPSLWGAFALAALDGERNALERYGQPIMIALGVVAGVVLSGVFVIDAPVSMANLALGTMEAFFFLMWIGNDQSPFGRIEISSRAQPWGVALLLMTTIVAITVAVTA